MAQLPCSGSVRDVDKYNTSESSANDRYRRSPTTSGIGWSRGELRGRPTSCPARAICRRSSASAGSRSARPWRRSATRAWSTHARASGGSSARRPLRQPLPSWTRSSASSRERHASGAADHRVRVRRRAPATSPSSSAATRCCESSASTGPTAIRSPSSPCGAPPSSARAVPRATSSASRSTSCSASRCAARRRRSAPLPRAPTTPKLLEVPVGSRCCAASASPPTPAGGRSCWPAHLPGASHGVRRRPAHGRAVDAPSGLRLVE